MRLNHIRNNKFLLIVLIPIILASCTKLESKIINKCSSDIEINIQYDKEIFFYFPDGEDGFYNWLEKTTEKSSDKRIIFDKNTLTDKYLLHPNDTFFIIPAVKFKHKRDTAYTINSISMINGLDTIFINNPDVFRHIFFNDSAKYNPLKLEDSFFRDIKD